jgi:hypothetical protein
MGSAQRGAARGHGTGPGTYAGWDAAGGRQEPDGDAAQLKGNQGLCRDQQSPPLLLKAHGQDPENNTTKVAGPHQSNPNRAFIGGM